MIFSLDDLVTPLTRQQVEASIYEVLGIVGVNTTTWKPGAVVRTMIVGASIVLAAFSSLTASIARSGFLELAEGPWLTLVAKYVYGVDRFEATFAEGEITLVNAGGGIYAVDPEDLIVSSPITGKAYRNTEAFSLGAMATLTIPIRASEAGSSSTAPANTITAMQTVLLGVTCSNALALVGRDEELDPDLRARCSEKLGSLSPFGPPDAYAYAARTAKHASGVAVGVNRVRTVKDGAGGVTTYVATASGAVTGDVDTLDSNLQVVDEAIQTLAAALADTAITLSATPVPYSVTYELWAYNTSGLTDTQIRDLVATKLATYTSSQPIGGNVIGLDPGKLFLSAIEAVIGAARPEIFKVVLSLPASDLELEIGEVAVLGTVIGTVHQVAPSTGI